MSGHLRLMHLFLRTTTCLSAAALCFLWLGESRLCHAQTSTPDEPQVTLKVKNDVKGSTNRPQPVTLRLWSEKPWNPKNPVREQVIRAGQTATIDLLSPDRYTVEVQWRNNIWRSLPMHLKAAVKEHPDKVLQLSTVYTAPMTKSEIPPAIEIRFGSDISKGFDSSDLKLNRDLHQLFNEPGNWPRMIEFRNDYHDADGKAQAVEVRMRSERPLTAPGAQPSSGVKLSFGPGAADRVNLVSPDPFTIVIVADGKEYSANGLPLKNALMGNESTEGVPTKEPYKKAFIQIGSLSNSNEPTLTLQGTCYDEEFRDLKTDKPIDLLHRPEKPPAK
jgi:hypothetical protein